jgi:hypothetical protein
MSLSYTVRNALLTLALVIVITMMIMITRNKIALQAPVRVETSASNPAAIRSSRVLIDALSVSQEINQELDCNEIVLQVQLCAAASSAAYPTRIFDRGNRLRTDKVHGRMPAD